MADVKWIKLNVGMFDGNSFKRIKRAKIGGESFRDKLTAVWFELMDFAGKCNAGGQLIESPEIPFSNIGDIAILIDREEEELNLCMQYYISNGMITVIDDVYMLTNWAKYQNEEGLNKIREQTRKRVAKHRENQKALPCNAECNVTVTLRNATDIDIEREKEKEKDSKNNNKCASKAQVDSFFESIWELYPVKKGKGQVSDAKRKALYAIGYDAIKRAIDRYLNELQKDSSWRKAQNGSTFFNSGYVDYLDNNFVPDEKKATTTSKNQPSYDLVAFERMMDAQVNPPKTAADDESIRIRMEALRSKIAE